MKQVLIDANYFAYAVELLPPEVLTEDPVAWRPPTSDEIRLIVGRSSETGISGAKAACLIGVTDAAFRKYTAGEGATRRHTISFAAWHLLLHRLGIRRATIDNTTPKVKAEYPTKTISIRYPQPKSNDHGDEKYFPRRFLRSTDAQMASKIPQACRPLFEALVDATPLQPMSVAAEMVEVDSATAAMLSDHLEQVDKDSRLAQAVLNALRPMIAREVLRNARAEIEKNLGDAE